MSIRLERISLANTDCSTGVDTSNGDVFQLNANDGCLYELPMTKHYVNTGYVNDGYVGNGQVICPNE